MQHTYYISIGSNVADATSRVAEAESYLCRVLGDCRVSSVYTTPAMGGKPVNAYTNAVAVGTSSLEPDELNCELKAYESSAGRDRSRKGVVAIDLDIVIADGDVVRPTDFDALHFQLGYKEL